MPAAPRIPAPTTTAAADPSSSRRNRGSVDYAPFGGDGGTVTCPEVAVAIARR
jgi:hypothetical protein